MNIPDDQVIVVTEEQYVFQKRAGNGTALIACVPCQRRALVDLKSFPVYKRRVVVACNDCGIPVLSYGPYYGGESC